MAKLPIHLGGHFNRTHVDEGLLLFARDVLGVRSLIDIGCGPGGMVKAARDMGIEAWGIDGDYTLKRDEPSWFFVHDYTKGPFTANTIEYDMAWCCEFVEHVHKEFEPNYIATFKSAKRVFMTYSDPGKPGHHHVNCEPSGYWVDLLEHNGFRLDDILTIKARAASTMARDFFRTHGLVFERKT